MCLPVQSTHRFISIYQIYQQNFNHLTHTKNYKQEMTHTCSITYRLRTASKNILPNFQTETNCNLIIFLVIKHLINCWMNGRSHTYCNLTFLYHKKDIAWFIKFTERQNNFFFKCVYLQSVLLQWIRWQLYLLHSLIYSLHN